MLPYSTLNRKQRDISKGKIDGRSQEIQRPHRTFPCARAHWTWNGSARAQSGWIGDVFAGPTAGHARRRSLASFIALSLAFRKTRRLRANSRTVRRCNPVCRCQRPASSVPALCLTLAYDEDVAASVDMNPGDERGRPIHRTPRQRRRNPPTPTSNWPRCSAHGENRDQANCSPCNRPALA